MPDSLRAVFSNPLRTDCFKVFFCFSISYDASYFVGCIGCAADVSICPLGSIVVESCRTPDSTFTRVEGHVQRKKHNTGMHSKNKGDGSEPDAVQ